MIIIRVVLDHYRCLVRFDELAQFPLRVGEAVHRSEAGVAGVVEHADVLAQDDFRGEKIEPNVLPEIDDPRGVMSMNTNVTVLLGGPDAIICHP